MKYKTTHTSIRMIRKGDPNFTMEENHLLYPRASLEISNRCPDNYRSLIEECVRHGWIKPVAYVRNSELFWDEFKK